MLIRPADFDDAENFDGFQQQSTQSSVMVTMFAGPFSAVAIGFTAENLKSKGMALVSKEDVEIDGSKGILAHVTQTAYGTEYAKWLCVFGDENQTTIVTATFPKELETELSDELKSVVLTARLDVASPPGVDIGFTVAASEKMKITQGVSKMLSYTKDGVHSDSIARRSSFHRGAIAFTGSDCGQADVLCPAASPNGRHEDHFDHHERGYHDRRSRRH